MESTMTSKMWPALGLACVTAVALAAAPAAEAASPRKSDKPAVAAKKAKEAGPIVTSVAPPSGQWEGKPPPAEGYIWSAGFYNWTGERYEWKAGEWVLDKPGMDYRQHQWVQRPDGKWQLTGGNWVPEGSTHAASK